MNRTLKIGIVIANLLLVLGIVNGAILKKQAIVETGRVIFLELAPVDPRSLMQGDYMILSYGLSRDQEFRRASADRPTRGKAVLKLDDDGKATFARIDDGSALAENEVFIRYRKWRRGFKFGLESFFFQEGQAEKYEDAKFAKVRISDSGEAVLIDLHDAVATKQ